MNRRYVIPLVTVLAIMLLTGCGGKNRSGTVNRPSVAGVTVTAVAKVETPDTYETAGTIKAKTVSVLASKVMGMVTAVPVKLGDRVDAGQVLITIDDSDLSARAAAAEAAYREASQALAVADQNRALADITYQRYQKLYAENAISRQQMDQTATQQRIASLEQARGQAAVDRARAEASAASVLQGFSRIVSPVNGVVTAKMIDEGSMAVPGVPLLTVEDTTAYTIEADIDENLAARVRVGQSAAVIVGSGVPPYSATITEIAPAIDPAARKFHIKAQLSGNGIRSGLYAKLQLPLGMKQAITLPAAAVVEKGQLTGVYVVAADGVITYRLVRTGRVYGDQVEILSGLDAGENVITGGVDKAVDGGVLKEVAPQ